MIVPSVCVFCGSRPGKNPAHEAAATAFGRIIARNRWRLVYGAGNTGIMGAVARAAQAGGAPILGVIPAHLLPKERAGRGLTGFLVTETMHERKKVMFMNSDAAVLLPGGIGSVDEFVEVLTWAQLGLHAKPLFILDVAGYWQPLIALLHHMVAEGFADEGILARIRVTDDVAALETDLAASFGATRAVVG